MRLVVLSKMGLLTETFPAEAAREGLLARVGANVHVDGVLVLEALGADAAVMQRPLFAHAVVGRRRPLVCRLLGTAVRALVLLRCGLRAGYHRGGYRDRRCQVIEDTYGHDRLTIASENR